MNYKKLYKEMKKYKKVLKKDWKTHRVLIMAKLKEKLFK